MDTLLGKTTLSEMVCLTSEKMSIFFSEKKKGKKTPTNRILFPSVYNSSLTLKAPITTKADDNFDFFFFFQKKVLTCHVNRLPCRRFT